jgi:dolichol-phosphate mannosyltransferase
MNWPLSRLLLSTGAGIYVRLVTGMPVADPTGGFKCFRREVLEAIKLDEIRSNGYSFQIEMNHTAWRMGYRLREVPIVFGERRSGYSKMRAGIAAEAFGMVLKLLARNSFSRKPRAKKRNDD